MPDDRGANQSRAEAAGRAGNCTGEDGVRGIKESSEKGLFCDSPVFFYADNDLKPCLDFFILDIRFEKDDTVVLIETKQSFKKSDEAQLDEYLQQERVLHYGIFSKS
ncbi:MAG: hypothetical protein UHS49_06780 [Faecalimonas sp.]|nr:hypothetical protein [Faecalimonas sp.]